MIEGKGKIAAEAREEHIQVLAELFALLSDPSRLRITLACLDRTMAVGDIAQELGLSPSLVSHHLRLLRTARLVVGERSGRHVFYRVDDEHIRRMLTDMVEHAVYG